MIQKLAGITVIVSILGLTAWWGQHPSSQETNTRLGRPLLPQLNSQTLYQIHIQQDDQSLTLQKTENHHWIVLSEDYSADVSKVQEFLLQFLHTPVSDLITQKAKNHARFDVQHGTQITLSHTADHPSFEIILGKSRERGGQYVRYAQSDEVYLIGEEIRASLDVKDWLNKTLLTINDPQQVQRLHWASADQSSFLLERQEAGSQEWSSPQIQSTETLKTSAITGLLNELKKIPFEKFSTPPQDATSTNQTQLKIQLFNGQQFQINFLEPTDSKAGTYLAQVSLTTTPNASSETQEQVSWLNQQHQDRWYQMSAWVAKKFLKTLDDFQEGESHAQ